MSLGGITSPQPAACAPSGAALPLSSSTTTPNRSQDSKTAAVRHRTPPTIKQWLSPSSRTSEQAGSPAHQVLSQSPQSSASSTPPTERRAKRRLETGDGSSSNCEGTEQCDCVTELSPAAKRSRTLSGVCCPAQESPAQTDCQTEDNNAASSRQTDKENCSPRGVNWLSVMSQKLRKGQRSPGSPKGPRSPSAAKKQESKTPASPVSIKLTGLGVD